MKLSKPCVKGQVSGSAMMYDTTKTVVFSFSKDRRLLIFSGVHGGGKSFSGWTPKAWLQWLFEIRNRYPWCHASLITGNQSLKEGGRKLLQRLYICGHLMAMHAKTLCSSSASPRKYQEGNYKKLQWRPAVSGGPSAAFFVDRGTFYLG
ncbi:uncharacterized protein [Taeniopygia guttata]|uniref:uncharacterized protein n=1 Tax=Taeniopygia guttata TaxID=59729 RepID=UPI003BB89B66